MPGFAGREDEFGFVRHAGVFVAGIQGLWIDDKESNEDHPRSRCDDPARG
jgi:hypothetical protein